MSQVATPQDRLAKKKANTVRVWIAMDAELADAEARAKGEADLARLRYEASPGDPERALEFENKRIAHEEALEDLRNNAVQFVFKALPRKKYEDLVDKHPPTEDQRKTLAAKGGNPRDMPWNADTFPPEIVFQSLVEPQFESRAEFFQLVWENEEWNGAETMTLLEAALSANSTRRQVELGKG